MYSIIFYMNFELVFRHSDRGTLGTPGSLYTRMNWMRSRFSIYSRELYALHVLYVFVLTEAL